MNNPYTPPQSGHSVAAGIAGSKTARRICLSISMVAIVVFLVVSWVLISQSIRLGNEEQSPNIPPRLQGSSGMRSMAFASLVGGITAIVGAALNILAIVLSRRGKIALSILAIVLSIVSMMVVGLMFSPV